MNAFDRKAAIAAYKKLDRQVGVYALRCGPSGAVWVGQATSLDKIWNRIRFTLEHGSHPSRTLQAAWREHGADGFAFEVLERIEDEAASYILHRVLKERVAHWRTRLAEDVV